MEYVAKNMFRIPLTLIHFDMEDLGSIPHPPKMVPNHE